LTCTRTSTHNQTVSTTSTPQRWTPATRLAFRITFVYFLLYALGCGNATVWEILPGGMRLEGWAARPFEHTAQFTAQHLLHMQGVAAHLHPSGFNDRALDWIAAALMLAAALAIAPLWFAVDRRRTEYTTLWRWLRFLLRLSLAVGMFVYGVMKLYPFQIAPPSLAVLNEPLGSMSPMTLLWSALGYSPLYERLCGCIEIVAALLLLLRRSALAGTLLSIVVLANVCLFDVFFDVPVKLYAANLLLMALVVAAPDASAMMRFFWSHQPATLTSAWTPSTANIRLRRTFVVLEVLTLIYGCITLPLRDHTKFSIYANALANPSPLTGQWHIDSATLNGQPHPLFDGDGQPITDIFLEPNARVTLRAADGVLWDGTTYDAANHMLTLFSSTRQNIRYTIAQPDATHLTLTPIADTDAPGLHLTRVPLPTQYPLYQRGFHLTNEWGFER
jgi:hypothetical protein